MQEVLRKHQAEKALQNKRPGSRQNQPKFGGLKARGFGGFGGLQGMQQRRGTTDIKRSRTNAANTTFDDATSVGDV